MRAAAWWWRGAALASALIAISTPVRAQTQAGPVVRGVVVDTIGQPIPLTEVGIQRVGTRLADDSGRFAITLPAPGPIALSVRRVGFQAYQVSLRIISDTTLLLVMRPVQTALEPVRTETDRSERALELSGFYDRLDDRKRGVNSGWFLTPEDLQKRQATHATNLLRSIPGVQVRRYYLSGYEWDGLVDSRNCPLTVYLDGIRLGPPGRFGSALANPGIPAEIDAVVPPSELAGVEVYTRSAPTGYEMLSGNCGVAMFWTK